jgi:hypothetical protein
MNSTKQKKKLRVHDASLYPTQSTHTPPDGSQKGMQELQSSATNIESAPHVSYNEILSLQSKIQKLEERWQEQEKRHQQEKKQYHQEEKRHQQEEKRYHQEKKRHQQLSVVLIDLMNMTQSGKPITSEMVHRLRIVQRTIKTEESEDALKRLTADLVAADKNVARCRKMLDALIGGQYFVENVEFPINPSCQSIDQDWHTIREEIFHSTRTANSSPLPPQELLEHFALAVNRLLEGQDLEEWCLEWISSQASKLLENRCILQTLLGALVCHRVFVGSMSLFDGQHCAISMNIYSLINIQGMFMRKIRVIIVANALIGGLEAVWKTDLRATKMLIEDKISQDDIIQKEATVISDCVSQLLNKLLYSQAELSNGDNFYPICKLFIYLKLKLMISSEDYRIFYYQPGDQYDSTWMEAEDEDGRSLEADMCNSKKISLCLFPAVAQHQSDLSELDPDDITAVFACNKRFSFRANVGDVVEPQAIVSKAVVLIER